MTEQPQEGKVYQISGEDCCLTIKYTGRLVSFENEDNRETWVFDDGTQITSYGLEYKEIKVEEK
jgi:hypothetical protein